MRFIHTADWHIGKKLREHSLIEDQYFVLSELLKLIDDLSPDAIIIAGDIYDSRIPPAEAVDLCDEIFTKILLEKKVPILGIAGNHDSAARLNFGSKLFEKNNFFLRSHIIANSDPVILNDDFGKVYFSLIPYFHPAKVRDAFNLPTNQSLTYDQAANILIDAARSRIPKKQRSIAIAHLFIAGSIRSDSEDSMVGGIDVINPENFINYNYVALGHLHKPQSKFAGKIRYSGSLLKYSFDEEFHHKGVDLVSMDSDGITHVEQFMIKPLHDVRTISGFLNDILQNEQPSKDYILVKLKDNEPFNAGDRLRKALFDNLLAIEDISNKATRESEELQSRENLNDDELFELFFKEMTGRVMNDQERSVFLDCFHDLLR